MAKVTVFYGIYIFTFLLLTFFLYNLLYIIHNILHNILQKNYIIKLKILYNVQRIKFLFNMKLQRNIRYTYNNTKFSRCKICSYTSNRQMIITSIYY